MRLKTLLFLIITAGLLVGPANLQAPSTAAATRAIRSDGAAVEVSPERIANHLSFLASDKLQGRRAGTPAANEAARYIAGEFRKYGLSPPASKDFLEPFSFVAEVKVGGDNRLKVRLPRETRSLRIREDFMPLAFSASAPAAGPVVFAGYGISAPELQYDNYAGVDVKGKFVLVLRGSPDGDNPHGRFADRVPLGREIEVKTIKARELGAAGIILVSSAENFKDDRLSQLRHDLNFLDGGIPAAIISREVARVLVQRGGGSLSEAEKQFKEKADPIELKDIAVDLKTDVVKVNKESFNVVGMVRGSDPRLASEYVVIGAHYDHLGLGGLESLAPQAEGQIHHGADDNASGTSALLDLAKVVGQGGAVRGKRSVVFCAFGGEELGLLGSSAYTKNPPVPLESTVAMINMDMIGRLRNGAVVVGGAGTSPAWKPLLEKLVGGHGPAASGVGAETASSLKLALQDDGYGPSDHQSFYVRNIPVLFFFTGSHEDYHKPSDTADKINVEGVRQIAELVRKIALSVANEDQRIAFNKVKTETRPAGRGFRVYLGTIPSYADQTDGMKLDGVRPGSPAERAGLRAGDVVTRIGKLPIKNVYDYTYALGEMKPGEEIEVAIRRDGKEVAVKLTPERRQ